MKKKCVLGIDGGGTKTKLWVCDINGNLLSESKSGPSNLGSASYTAVYNNLKELIYKGYTPVADEYEVASVCIGSAGIAHSGAAETLLSYLKEFSGCNNVKVVGDMEIALWANLSNPSDEGVLIISGTGSICFGKDKNNKTVRVGGWGHILGDEGSGYWIGLEALKFAIRELDADTLLSPLSKAVLEFIGASTQKEVVAYATEPAIDKAKIASICVEVENCANNGDIHSISILEQAANWLYSITAKTIDRMACVTPTIIIGGSVLTKCDIIRKRFELLTNNNNYGTIVKANRDAAYGAVLIALENIERVHDYEKPIGKNQSNIS